MIALSSGTLEAIMDRVVRLPVEGGGMINYKRSPVLDLFPALRSWALQILKSLASVLRGQMERDALRKRLVELNERVEAQIQAQRAAVQERERLARELHDSVLQAFFGISLEAQLAEEEQEMDPEQWRSVLERIISLAEGGQAEMRALLFELRPESMEGEELIGALLKLVSAQRTSHALVVEAELDEGKEPALSPEGKHALYRIAQEAFHNIVKHAQASRVVLRLDSNEREVVMVIQDNGRGFDPRASFPGHLGLWSMRERVASLQGEILIESSPGQGTTITVRVPTTTRGEAPPQAR